MFFYKILKRWTHYKLRKGYVGQLDFIWSPSPLKDISGGKKL